MNGKIYQYFYKLVGDYDDGATPHYEEITVFDYHRAKNAGLVVRENVVRDHNDRDDIIHCVFIELKKQ